MTEEERQAWNVPIGSMFLPTVIFSIALSWTYFVAWELQHGCCVISCRSAQLSTVSSVNLSKVVCPSSQTFTKVTSSQTCRMDHAGALSMLDRKYAGKCLVSAVPKLGSDVDDDNGQLVLYTILDALMSFDIFGGGGMTRLAFCLADEKEKYYPGLFSLVGLCYLVVLFIGKGLSFALLVFFKQPQLFRVVTSQQSNHKQSATLRQVTAALNSFAGTTKLHGISQGISELSHHIRFDGVAQCLVMWLVVTLTFEQAINQHDEAYNIHRSSLTNGAGVVSNGLDMSSEAAAGELCPAHTVRSILWGIFLSIWRGAVLKKWTLLIVLAAGSSRAYFGCSTMRFIAFFVVQFFVAAYSIIAFGTEEDSRNDIPLTSIAAGVAFVLELHRVLQMHLTPGSMGANDRMLSFAGSGPDLPSGARPEHIVRTFKVLDTLMSSTDVWRCDVLAGLLPSVFWHLDWMITSVECVAALFLLDHTDSRHVIIALIAYFVVYPFPATEHIYPLDSRTKLVSSGFLGGAASCIRGIAAVCMNDKFLQWKDGQWRRARGLAFLSNSRNIMFHDAMMSLNHDVPLYLNTHLIALESTHLRFIHDSYFMNLHGGLGIMDQEIIKALRRGFEEWSWSRSISNLTHQCGRSPCLLELLKVIVADALETMKHHTVRQQPHLLLPAYLPPWVVRTWIKTAAGSSVVELKGAVFVAHVTVCTKILMLLRDALVNYRLADDACCSCTCLVPLIEATRNVLSELIELTRWDEGMLCEHRLPPVSFLLGPPPPGQPNGVASLQVLAAEPDNGERQAWLDFRGACAVLAAQFLELAHGVKEKWDRHDELLSARSPVEEVLNRWHLPREWNGSCPQPAMLSQSQCIAHVAYAFHRRFYRGDSTPVFAEGCIKLLFWLTKSEQAWHGCATLSSAIEFTEAPSDQPTIFGAAGVAVSVETLIPRHLRSCHGLPIRNILLDIVLCPIMCDNFIRFPEVFVNALSLAEVMLRDACRIAPWSPTVMNAITGTLMLASRITQFRKGDMREAQSSLFDHFSVGRAWCVIRLDDTLVTGLYRCMRILENAVRAGPVARDNLFIILRAQSALLQDLPLSFGPTPGQVDRVDPSDSTRLDAVFASSLPSESLNRERTQQMVKAAQVIINRLLWQAVSSLLLEKPASLLSSSLDGVSDMLKGYRRRSIRVHEISRALLSASIHRMALPSHVLLQPHRKQDSPPDHLPDTGGETENEKDEAKDEAICCICLEELGKPNAERTSQLHATTDRNGGKAAEGGEEKEDDDGGDDAWLDDVIREVDVLNQLTGKCKMEAGVLAIVKTCRHSFHSECLFFWMIAHQECPICRSPL